MTVTIRVRVTCGRCCSLSDVQKLSFPIKIFHCGGLIMNQYYVGIVVSYLNTIDRDVFYLNNVSYVIECIYAIVCMQWFIVGLVTSNCMR